MSKNMRFITPIKDISDHEIFFNFENREKTCQVRALRCTLSRGTKATIIISSTWRIKFVEERESIHTYKHTYIYTQTHIYMHTHTQTYIYTLI